MAHLAQLQINAFCFAVFSPRVVAIAVARYNFCARDTRELSLMQGDLIKVYTKMSNGWWKGAIDGRVGLKSQGQPYWMASFSLPKSSVHSPVNVIELSKQNNFIFIKV